MIRGLRARRVGGRTSLPMSSRFMSTSCWRAWAPSPRVCHLVRRVEARSAHCHAAQAILSSVPHTAPLARRRRSGSARARRRGRQRTLSRSGSTGSDASIEKAQYDQAQLLLFRGGEPSAVRAGCLRKIRIGRQMALLPRACSRDGSSRRKYEVANPEHLNGRMSSAAASVDPGEKIFRHEYTLPNSDAGGCSREDVAMKWHALT